MCLLVISGLWVNTLCSQQLQRRLFWKVIFKLPQEGQRITQDLGGALASSHGPCRLFAAANGSIKAQLEGPWAVLEQTNSQSRPKPGPVTPQGVSSSPHQEVIVSSRQMRALRPQTAKSGGGGPQLARGHPGLY